MLHWRPITRKTTNIIEDRATKPLKPWKYVEKLTTPKKVGNLNCLTQEKTNFYDFKTHEIILKNDFMLF